MENLWCKIGFHKWMVHWIGVTGEAQCSRCGMTGIATPDGIQNRTPPP